MKVMDCEFSYFMYVFVYTVKKKNIDFGIVRNLKNCLP